MDQLRDQLNERSPLLLHEAAALAGTGVGSPPPVRLPSAYGLSFGVRAGLLAAVVIAVFAALTTMRSPATGPVAAAQPTRLEGGAASADELVRAFLDALSRSDRNALEALRVTEPEYRYLIVPGHVAAGAPPPRAMTGEAHEYFYGVMNTKSFYHRESLVHRYGGKKLTLDSFEFEKGIQEYAGHKDYKHLVVELHDDAGEQIEIRTGSIIERDGRFKFATYIRD